MMSMRRLFVSVALVAASLAVPQAAFAVGQPVITAPATGSYTNATPITITWDPVLDAATYRVFRADADCISNEVNLSGDLPLLTVSFQDAPVEGAYCYRVQDEGLVPGIGDVSNSAPVVVTFDSTPPVITECRRRRAAMGARSSR